MGLIGSLITILDILAYGVGFTFGIFGLLMLALSGIGEFIDIIELKEHHVVRLGVSTTEASEPNATFKISEQNTDEFKEGE